MRSDTAPAHTGVPQLYEGSGRSERPAQHRSRPWRLGRWVLLERRHRTPPGRGLPGAGAAVPADFTRRRRRTAAPGARVPRRPHDRRRGLDEGESLGALLSQGPVTPALAHLFTDARGFGWLSEDDFVNHFAGDVEPTRARVLYAVQQALASSAFTDVMGVPAWKSLPSWYLVAQNDEAIPPDAERQFAARMGATTVQIPSSHVAMVSHPAEVADLIEKAAERVGATATR